MGVIEQTKAEKQIAKQIKQRKQEALDKDFYHQGKDIVRAFGKKNEYDDGNIRVERFQWSQDWTGGEDNIEIFFKGNSVYYGRGNDYMSPYSESDIDRYVPGEWEETLKEIAERTPDRMAKNAIPTAAQEKKAELLKNWGIQ